MKALRLYSIGESPVGLSDRSPLQRLFRCSYTSRFVLILDLALEALRRRACSLDSYR